MTGTLFDFQVIVIESDSCEQNEADNTIDDKNVPSSPEKEGDEDGNVNDEATHGWDTELEWSTFIPPSFLSGDVIIILPEFKTDQFADDERTKSEANDECGNKRESTPEGNIGEEPERREQVIDDRISECLQGPICKIR